jgi:tetratricopeptide (TPR) repeat protein
MAHLEQVRALVIDARRAIVRADFAAADRALIQAERIDPRSGDVIAARRDLREAQERDARGDKRIDGLVTEARGAIARQDWAAADRLLQQAEQIDGRDRGVQAARGELANARQGNRDNRPIDGLVRDARAAIARHDLGEADRLLGQAEQIDSRDRTVQQVRTELNDARRQAGRDGNARLDPLLAEARAAITRRDFPTADRLLAQAEQIDPRDRSLQQMRTDLNEAHRQAERAGGSRFEPLLADARAAIARRDFVGADRLLLQAERIDPRDRDVQQTRAALNEAYRQAGGTTPRPSPNPSPDNRRIDALVAEARNAIARRDYVTADRLLDQAEGMDPRDRAVQQARAELRGAQQPGWGPRDGRTH